MQNGFKNKKDNILDDNYTYENRDKRQQKQEIREKLGGIKRHGNTILLEIQTMFPFDFFPDLIVIDPMKLFINHRKFLATEEKIIINIKDLADVIVERTLFLATLYITYLPKTENVGIREPIECKTEKLSYTDAMQAQKILKALMMMYREEIEISKMKPEGLKDIINHFGENSQPIPD